MRDFAAIDFETANFHSSSVCSVGIVIVRNGEVTDQFYSLIRPRPNFYCYRNIDVHGLTKQDTDDERNFPEVWAEVSERLEGLPLVAHNSRFDEGCLRAAFGLWRMDYPDYEFHCTLTASRRHLRLPNYQLHTVSAACGFDLENHHHALADAEACGAICMHISREFGDEAMFGN